MGGTDKVRDFVEKVTEKTGMNAEQIGEKIPVRLPDAPAGAGSPAAKGADGNKGRTLYGPFRAFRLGMGGI